MFRRADGAGFDSRLALLDNAAGNFLHPERVEQDFHVSQLVVVAVIADEFSGARPKFRAVNSKRRKHDFVLHVTRTECLIVIVNDRDGVLRRRHGKQLTI